MKKQKSDKEYSAKSSHGDVQGSCCYQGHTDLDGLCCHWGHGNVWAQADAEGHVWMCAPAADGSVMMSMASIIGTTNVGNYQYGDR